MLVGSLTKSRLLLQHIPTRHLTKTSQRVRPEPKHYRLWAIPGDLVRRKEVLAKQHTMLWHPGLNAGIDHDRAIYALCDGVMVITEEKFDPDWSHPLVSKVYMDGEDKRPAQYKRYINVIPKKRISEFKLIDEV